jgi:hypothetical protein
VATHAADGIDLSFLRSELFQIEGVTFSAIDDEALERRLMMPDTPL